MTEATGGITMTPPKEYVINSVGKSLPGIELKLADDGELCMRGPYVSNGFFKIKNSESFKDGWFYSGDIFEIKGETKEGENILHAFYINWATVKQGSSNSYNIFLA